MGIMEVLPSVVEIKDDGREGLSHFPVMRSPLDHFGVLGLFSCVHSFLGVTLWVK